MRPRPLALALALAFALLPEAAHAGRFRVHVRGGFHVGGSVVVRLGPPAPPPPPPPAYYDEACACEAPAPAPEPAYVQPTPIAPARRQAQLGIGLYASAVEMEDGAEASATGALLRLRLNRTFELEGEIAQTQFAYQDRVDTRVGGSLYVNLGQRGRLVPFLVVGAGVNAIEQGGMDEARRQGYLEAGGGLTFQITDRLSIAGDLRMQSRRLAEEDPAYHAAPGPIAEQEKATTARFAGILYF